MTTVYGVTMVGARAQIERQLLDRGDIPAAQCWSCSSYLAKRVSRSALAWLKRLASYILFQTIGCIGDLFKGANAIQNWLTQSARAIARSVPPARVEAFLEEKKAAAALANAPKDVEVTPKPKSNKKPTAKKPVKAPDVKQEQMTSVIWTTVLGLPIVQPYRKIKRRQVYTNLQSIYISDPSKPSEGVSPIAHSPSLVHRV